MADDLRAVESLTPDPFGPVRYVEETGSTNADLLGDADGPTGEVLVAGHQTAGRGRLDRVWEEPAGSSLMFSLRLRPTIPRTSWGWIPLLVGVAYAEALAGTAGLDANLKWPNDVLIADADTDVDRVFVVARKIAGILVEARQDVVVVGAGCNLTQTSNQLPVSTATSLAIEGAAVNPVELLAAVLSRLGERWPRFEGAGGDAESSDLHADYLTWCSTVGRDVVVTRPGGTLRGRVTGIGHDASLVLVPDHAAPGDAAVAVMAGDVTHVRAVR